MNSVVEELSEGNERCVLVCQYTEGISLYFLCLGVFFCLVVVRYCLVFCIASSVPEQGNRN